MHSYHRILLQKGGNYIVLIDLVGVCLCPARFGNKIEHFNSNSSCTPPACLPQPILHYFYPQAGENTTSWHEACLITIQHTPTYCKQNANHTSECANMHAHTQPKHLKIVACFQHSNEKVVQRV